MQKAKSLRLGFFGRAANCGNYYGGSCSAKIAALALYQMDTHVRHQQYEQKTLADPAF